MEFALFPYKIQPPGRSIEGCRFSAFPSVVNPLSAGLSESLDQAERVLRKYAPRTFESRVGLCQVGSTLLFFLFKRQGYQPQMYAFHECQSKIERSIRQSLFLRGSTGHFFVIQQDPQSSKSFLLDLTVGQFVQKDERGRLLLLNGYPLANVPVIQELMSKGYVEATPENLAAYFTALSHIEKTDYHKVQKACLTYFNNPSKPLDYLPQDVTDFYMHQYYALPSGDSFCKREPGTATIPEMLGIDP